MGWPVHVSASESKLVIIRLQLRYYATPLLLYARFFSSHKRTLMREQTLIFVAASFGLLTLNRFSLALWQWQRVRVAGGLWPILKGGLRIDATQVAMLAGLPILLSPWLGHNPLASTITAGWLLFAWFLLVLLEFSTPQFIAEYDTRPNRLYIEYLKHPKEVFGMLWRGYKLAIITALVSIALFLWAGFELFGDVGADPKLVYWEQILYTLVAAPVIFFAIRGTLSHRPINPSTVAYCGDGLLNTLPLNSLYSVLYAFYSIKNERSAADVYGKLPEAVICKEVNRCAGIATSNEQIPSLHHHQASHQRERPLNIVIIVEESLGAQHVARLGGLQLAPNIDKLMGEAWAFTRAYATGTRSVRGLEAVVAGFPPTISDAVLRLSGAQRNFFHAGAAFEATRVLLALHLRW